MAVPPLVETNYISPTSFAKLIPFFVVEQSERSCLCVHCYRSKLSTIALRKHWSTLHQGATPGSPCTCSCDLCTKDGGCAAFLTYAATNEVFSMGNLSDKLLCDKEFLYKSTEGGKRVLAHRSVCVSGHCPQCRQKQARLFDCPRNHGGVDRALVHPHPMESNERPGELQWDMFTTVDRAAGASRVLVGGDDDDYNDPRGGAGMQRKRKVNIGYIARQTKTLS